MVKVYSHRRSGTHLLLNTLFENFVFNESLALEVSVPTARWLGKDIDTIDVPYARLIGSHDPYSDVFDINQVLYILRNPLSVFISLYRGIDGGKRDQPIHDWVVSEDVVEHWLHHVESYVMAGCFYIKYEDITSDSFEMTMELIRVRYKLTPLNDNYKMVTKPVGWNPNYKDGINREDFLTQELVDHCGKLIPSGFMGYSSHNLWGFYD